VCNRAVAAYRGMEQSHAVAGSGDRNSHSSRLLWKDISTVKSAGIGLGLAIAAAAAAQILPSTAPFMQAMNASMKHMDIDMAAAPMSGDIDHDFAAMMVPHHRARTDKAAPELRYTVRTP
jgi:hypothetical protein